MLADTAIQEARSQAVSDALERIRDIVGAAISRDRLEEIKPVVVELAERTELFPTHQFPLGPDGSPRVYYLAQDPDGRFALYASAGAPGKSQPPHNHTTWAVISGVYGEEHNVLYRRTDDRSHPSEGTLEKAGEITVRRGNAVALMPDDFHTIRVTGSGNALHLHAYGRSLEQLPERITFESIAGGRWKKFPANPNITNPRISAEELKALLRSRIEFAILDARSPEDYARGHLLFASNAPLDVFEAMAVKLVPRVSACVVLCDAGGGEVDEAARVLRKLGYSNVSILDGGVKSWEAAGYELFWGFNVPSKAFGEVVERTESTPHISSVELHRMMEDGMPVTVLDSRPMEEFANMNVPGAVCCPGGELVYRASDALRDPSSLVVVGCAGRTRSIIGAQSLIEAGFPNRVVALHNGTMGWQLAGFALEHGCSRCAPDPSPDGAAWARKAADGVAQRYGVRVISTDELRAMEAERDRRTLYLFDVRTPDEYRAGHVPRSRSAPGGQLVQATDVYAGVRNARIVLIDADGVRARMTASWLVRMGAGEIAVLDASHATALATETGDERGWMPQFGATHHKPYRSAEEMESYLYWEVGLAEQVRRDGDAPFIERRGA